MRCRHPGHRSSSPRWRELRGMQPKRTFPGSTIKSALESPAAVLLGGRGRGVGNPSSSPSRASFAELGQKLGGPEGGVPSKNSPYGQGRGYLRGKLVGQLQIEDTKSPRGGSQGAADQLIVAESGLRAKASKTGATLSIFVCFLERGGVKALWWTAWWCDAFPACRAGFTGFGSDVRDASGVAESGGWAVVLWPAEACASKLNLASREGRGGGGSGAEGRIRQTFVPKKKLVLAIFFFFFLALWATVPP
ncbi:hypothetical protein VUR80DRAFT_2286 [Thermomyces stellatus]